VFPWLGPDETPADVLADLKTDEGTLSIFQVEDRTLVDDVLAAFASIRNDVVNLDYVLFDPAVIRECGIKVVTKKGETPDARVNDWHLDLTELTTEKLHVLASKIFRTAERDRKSWKEVGKLVSDAISSGRISETSLHQEMVQKLRKKRFLA
jgi:hypothetical protein